MNFSAYAKVVQEKNVLKTENERLRHGNKIYYFDLIRSLFQIFYIIL